MLWPLRGRDRAGRREVILALGLHRRRRVEVVFGRRGRDEEVVVALDERDDVDVSGLRRVGEVHTVVGRRDAADRHGVDEVLVGPIGALRGAQPFGGAGAPSERDHQFLQLMLVHLVEPGPAVPTDESVAGESLLILVRVCPRGRNLLRRDRTLDALPGRDLDEDLTYWR